MLPEELNRLVDRIVHHRCEMQNVELKKAEKGTPERLYDTLSGFSNQSGGGVIVFGIDEKNDFAVVGVYDAQDLQVKVTNYAQQMEPAVRPVFTVTDVAGKQVVSAEIPECDINQKPCYYKGAGKLRGSYVRVGEADLPMTEYEVYSYEAYKQKIRDELRIVDRATIHDFGQNEQDEYFVRIRKTKSQLAKMENLRILQLQGMVSGTVPTVAGVMILCEYPQAFFPQLGITAMVVDGTTFGEVSENGARFIDNQRIDGNIPQMLDEAMRFVRRNIRNATVIDADGKRADVPEYPLVAVREAILNALIHRDYSQYSEDSPIRIVLYKDRMEVENPGGLYGRLTINDLGKAPGDTRNPFLAGSLEILIDTENRFSGIPTMCAEMERAGLRPPVFESRRGSFRVTLYNERVPKRPADGAEAEQRILEFCKEPRSKREIVAMLGMQTAYYVAKHYLAPMVARGQLALTMPEKPTSRNQKYRTVSDLPNSL